MQLRLFGRGLVKVDLTNGPDGWHVGNGVLRQVCLM